MPFLNLNTGVLLYADSNVENPKIRLADVTDTFQQIIINNVRSNEIIIEPNESETIANTQRTLATITSTVFSCISIGGSGISKSNTSLSEHVGYVIPFERFPRYSKKLPLLAKIKNKYFGFILEVSAHKIENPPETTNLSSLIMSICS